MFKRLCGATTRLGDACRQPAMANGRCRLHGGAATPEQAGRYAEALPPHLWETFRTALADEALLGLRNEIALLDAVITELVRHSAALDDERGAELRRLIEQRRKLVTSELRGQELQGERLSRLEAEQLAAALLESVLRHVDDPAARQAIAAEFQRLLAS